MDITNGVTECLLLTFALLACPTEGLNISCPSSVDSQYGESLTLYCKFSSAPFGVYWYEERDTRVPLIRLQDGLRTGRGLDSGEYNITDNGDLLVIDANFSHDQKFQVYVIDKTFNEVSIDITVRIIQGCRASSAVLGQQKTIGCSFRPGFLGIYWYGEEDKEDPFIRLEDGARYGRGFDSGEYNITNNGSLVVNQVLSARNYSIYVINRDVSDATFYAQLTIADEQSATTRPNTIPHLTERDLHGSTTPIGNTTQVSSTVKAPNTTTDTTTDESGHNRIPTEKIVPEHTTDVRNEIGKLLTEGSANKKWMIPIAVCISIIILGTMITVFVKRKRRKHKNQEIPREGVQV